MHISEHIVLNILKDLNACEAMALAACINANPRYAQAADSLRAGQRGPSQQLRREAQAKLEQR